MTFPIKPMKMQKQKQSKCQLVVFSIESSPNFSFSEGFLDSEYCNSKKPAFSQHSSVKQLKQAVNEVLTLNFLPDEPHFISLVHSVNMEGPGGRGVPRQVPSWVVPKSL